MAEDVVLSVWCITYNHAPYIRNALDSFINQKTDYKYEILVHDDASTDGTIEILKEYEKRFPELVRVFYEEKNQYSQGRFNLVLQKMAETELRGRYVAICEGDDCWVDFNKLQLQIDYMERHPECSMTGHNVVVMNNRQNTIIPWQGLIGDRNIDTEELIINNKGGFQTSSFVLRRDVLNVHWMLMQDCDIGDWPMRLAASTCGTVHYFDRVMSAYRSFNSGAWSSRIENDYHTRLRYHMTFARYLQRFDNYTDRKYHKWIQIQIDAALLHIVSLTREKSMQEFVELCYSVNIDIPSYLDIIDILTNMKQELAAEDHRLREFAMAYKKIYIMGTGEYAEQLVALLEKLKIDFDGFVVSNDQSVTQEFFGKKIYHLCEVADCAKEIGIMVAIKKNIKHIIEASLESNGITHYIWPLL